MVGLRRSRRLLSSRISRFLRRLHGGHYQNNTVQRIWYTSPWSVAYLDFQFTAVGSVDDGVDSITARSRTDIPSHARPGPPTLPKTLGTPQKQHTQIGRATCR